MRNLMIIAVGAALLASAPLAATAQDGQPMSPPGGRHGDAQSDPRPGMQRPGERPGQGHDTNRGDMDHGNMDHSDYGRWDNGWGARPPPPPKHFSQRGNWYQHVRACAARYRSYNPRTDTYQVRRGAVARCRL